MNTKITKEQIKNAIESFDSENFFTKNRIEEVLRKYADDNDPTKISQEGLMASILDLSKDFTADFVYSVLVDLFNAE